MFRVVALAVIHMLLFNPMAATQASAQALALPALDAAGMTTPLTLDQLDPAERARFGGLTPASDDARQFLYTRGYLRYCRLVADGSLAPLSLPGLPAEEDWDRQFLSEEEAREVVDYALGLKMMAMMGPPPAVDPGMAAPLTADQLDPAERARFDGLTPGSDDARQFLYTRGYLRYCRLVADGSLAPLSLPDLPAEEDWDRQFLSEEEAREVVDYALGLKLMAMMKPPAQ